MGAETWITILHDISTIATTAAAAIAAVSSVKNGQTLKENHEIIKEVVRKENKVRKSTTKNDDSDDWYQPPNFGPN